MSFRRAISSFVASVILVGVFLPLSASADYTYTYQNCGRGGCSSWLTSAAYPTRAACDTARSERPVSGPPHGACNGTDTAGSGGTGTQYCFTAQTRGTSNAQRECFATNQACGTGRTAAEARGDAVTVCAPVSNAAGGVTGNIAVSDGAPINYQPLVDLPFVGSGPQTIGGYLAAIFRLLIGLAGGIAVVRMVICGFRAVMSVNPSAREEASQCVVGAIAGLLLAFSSWLILNQINPALLSTAFAPPGTGSAAPVGGAPLPPGSCDTRNLCQGEAGPSCSNANPSCAQYSAFATEFAGGGISANLIREIMAQESGCNVGAGSGAGACGLMQLLPTTASQHKGECGIPNLVNTNCAWLQDPANARLSVSCRSRVASAPRGKL